MDNPPPTLPPATLAKRLLPSGLSAVLAALLGGCAAVGPDYVPPALDLPAAWHGQTASDAPATPDLAAWWTQFNDPVLSDLIRQALASSPDMRTASARLREARARLAQAEAGFLPVVSASAATSGSKGSRATGGSGATRRLYSAGFDASWEADLFRGIRRETEAASADLEASMNDLHASQVSLAAEVALNYVSLRSARALLEIARASLASQEETLQLTQWRSQAGLVSSLDVEQARGNAAQTRAQIPSLEASASEAENRLAILLGKPPGSLHEQLAGPASLPAASARVAVGIPADILRQRPDVRAAERRLAAETARVGQAMAARYPGLTLSGSLGLESLTLSALTGGDAVSRSLLASLTATLFDGGRLRQQVEIQNAVQERALVTYEQTVLTALEEVENALTGVASSQRRQAALQEAAAAARTAAQLARQRYSAGIIDFQTVLDTERSLLSREDSLKSAEAAQATALIQLYKALGGGWTTAGTVDIRNASDRNLP